MSVEFLSKFVTEMSNEELHRLIGMTQGEIKRREYPPDSTGDQPAQPVDVAKAMGYGGAQSVNRMRDRSPEKAAGQITLDNIESVMSTRQWGSGQRASGNVVREALVAAAKAILREVPQGAEKERALQHILSARMHANVAISFDGEF